MPPFAVRASPSDEKEYICRMMKFQADTGTAKAGRTGTLIRAAAACIAAIFMSAIPEMQAQSRREGKLTPQQHQENLMEYMVEGADTVYVEEFSGQSRLTAIAAEGAALAAESGQEPRASAGLLYDGLPHWEAGREYVKNELFTYAGMVGYARQAHTSQAAYTPFSAGTESLYGVRPVPDDYGIYPYAYNMKSEVGMRVRSAKDSAVYVAIQPADPLLYDPADVPALFEKEETEE